ncbi:uncharacterized protein SPSK_05762 [Sporothrix schenckii 1099-18]|uniref:Uncharacterized protein n=1 Tax=Sporothrix schenckii 1099-18 TaxID=1397361 RepID=A0A0F2LTM4_SPOSC|nr:uncharacterized protein SPSK_05762 [Sporothrix schenckii 1099-18]KJR80832.1 hypothetical protein SPSK_05762 [Sporothrix schenckii 1099-18]
METEHHVSDDAKVRFSADFHHFPARRRVLVTCSNDGNKKHAKWTIDQDRSDAKYTRVGYDVRWKNWGRAGATRAVLR